jgi:phospho-N-acetylmuramoyl-pentapeptide-transferase
MSLRILCVALAFFAIAIYCQGIWIGWMNRYRLGQAIKEYGPAAHLKKTGTPSMGGVVALLLAPLAVVSSKIYGDAAVSSAVFIWAFPAATALVGLTDDLMKLSSGSSEGLKSLQKLFLQIAVTIPWALWVGKGGVYLLPSIMVPALYGVPLLVFLAVGIQNAVNVTDGLDGLAGGAVALSLAALVLLSKSASVTLAAAIGLALVTAFLWHNSNPAELFMGDVGAHLWAGLLIALCVKSRSLILIFPTGFLFGVEIFTVAIQIAAIRKFNRKIFLMSPLHHHFELIGWKEPRIVTRFCLAHLAGMVTLLIVVISLYRGDVCYAGR